MKCYKESMNGGCGITIFSDFNNNDHWNEKKEIFRDIEFEDSGAGWGIATFINTNHCKEAYEEICRTYHVLFQSPVRENQNTNNNFFFIIFDLYNELPPQEVSWGL